MPTPAEHIVSRLFVPTSTRLLGFGKFVPEEKKCDKDYQPKTRAMQNNLQKGEFRGRGIFASCCDRYTTIYAAKSS